MRGTSTRIRRLQSGQHSTSTEPSTGARNERPPGRRDSASAHKERPQPGTPPAPTAPPAPPPSTTPVPANSYLRAERVRCALRARHPATSRRTGHSPPDPPGAPGTRRPHPAPRPSLRARTCEPNSYGARYELGTQLRVGAPGTRRPTRRAHPALAVRTPHHARPANSYLCAELVRCTLRARHTSTSRRTGHSPFDPTGAHGASAPGAHRPHPALATPRSPAGARPTRPAAHRAADGATRWAREAPSRRRPLASPRDHSISAHGTSAHPRRR